LLQEYPKHCSALNNPIFIDALVLMLIASLPSLHHSSALSSSSISS
jgi:hypothetical protein